MYKIKEKAGVVGKHTFTFYDMTNPVIAKLSEMIEFLLAKRAEFIESNNWSKEDEDMHACNYRSLIEEMDLYKTREVVVYNLTTNVGLNNIARRLAGDTTYTGIINYTALGDDNTAPALGNTSLGNEVYRKAVSSQSFSGQTANIETFFTATETSGTYEEYGNFIDGTGTADSGLLFNRFTQSVTKSATETLNVRSEITLSNA